MRRNKRSQMEIMGLAIIIILVSLAMLFAVTWMLNPKASQTQKAKESVVAANFLSAMLGTTTDCNKRTVGDLLRDCALTQGASKCEAQTSCEYANDVIGRLFNATLNTWNRDYYFHMTGAPSVEKMTFAGKNKGPCKGAKEGKSQPFSVTPSFEISIALEICS
jgi:hypothetical protein